MMKNNSSTKSRIRRSRRISCPPRGKDLINKYFDKILVFSIKDLMEQSRGIFVKRMRICEKGEESTGGELQEEETLMQRNIFLSSGSV